MIKECESFFVFLFFLVCEMIDEDVLAKRKETIKTDTALIIFSPPHFFFYWKSLVCFCNHVYGFILLL